MKDKLIIEWKLGRIDSIVKEAILFSQVTDCNIEFVFNGVTATVDADCDIDSVCNKVLECVRNEIKNVDFTCGNVSVY